MTVLGGAYPMPWRYVNFELALGQSWTSAPDFGKRLLN
jgi:hypothetical protein